MFLSNLRVDISFGCFILLSFDYFLKGHFDWVFIVFDQSFIVHLNTFIIFLLLEVSITLSGQDFSKFNIIISSCFRYFNCIITSLNTSIIILHFEINCSFVWVICKLTWTKFNCFSIELKSFLKVSSFVEHSSFSLCSFSLLFDINSISLLFWKCSFFSFLSLFLVVCFLGLGSNFGFLSKVTLLFCSSLLILVHLEQVDPSKLLKDIHKSWIGLK